MKGDREAMAHLIAEHEGLIADTGLDVQPSHDHIIQHARGEAQDLNTTCTEGRHRFFA